MHQAVVVNLTRATGRTGRVGRCDDLLPEWAAPARSWRLQEGLPLHGCEDLGAVSSAFVTLYLF